MSLSQPACEKISVEQPPKKTFRVLDGGQNHTSLELERVKRNLNLKLDLILYRELPFKLELDLTLKPVLL